MRRPALLPIRFILLILLLTGMALLITTGPRLLAGADDVTAQDPNFSDVDDPLNGDYELFTVDDLVLMRTKPENNNTKSAVLNYILETENKTISSQSVKNADFPNCYLNNNRRQPQQTRIGRFFDLTYDVTVTLLPYGATASGSNCTAPSGQPNMALHTQSTKSSANSATPFTMSATNTAVAMDDFNFDGFADLFMMSNSEALVATARDVTNVSDGMKFGPVTPLGSSPAAAKSPVTGDFNADGLIDVAWNGGGGVHFATVCPTAVAGTMCAGKEALEVIFNTESLPGGMAIAAGNFATFDGVGLIKFDYQSNGDYVARWYQFDSSFKPIGGAPIATQTVYTIDVQIYANGGSALAVTERLDWFGSTDQVVFAKDISFVSGGGNETYIGMGLFVVVINFDLEENTMIPSAWADPDTHSTGLFVPTNPPWLNGLATGHFATITDDTTAASGFNPQIAVLTNNGVVKILSVDPPTSFKPVQGAKVTLESGLGINFVPTAGFQEPQQPVGLNWLTAGDLQGRSQRLGAPSVVRVASHSQPSVILGTPPMHVDYILPDSSTSTEWEVINFTAVPDTYLSKYAMNVTSSSQSSDTNQTSYSFGTTQPSSKSFSYKPPDLPSISGSIKSTTKNKHETVSENYAFQQNEFAYDASTKTGFGDEIWFDESTFNIYYYPVLGQKVCPEDNSGCAANEKQQLYVSISGPNSGGTGPAPGANTEWYQPIHEPGNIFSYPWSESMLAKQIPGGLDLLTSPQPFFTDDSDQSQSLTWSQSQGKSQTAGATNSHSYEKSYSLTGGSVIGFFLDDNLKGSFSYNDSSAISTMNKSTSSVGASQGVVIDKPGTFLNIGLYQYRVFPFIFGRNPQTGRVDDPTLSEEIKTSGPLQTAFAVDPRDSLAGSWWQDDTNPYHQHIDVALNHPQRWFKNDPTGNQDGLNCLESSGTRNNCFTLNQPNLSNLWNSEFHWMRGLLVTVGGEDGPQRNKATAGEEVTLLARVYNYSFKDMPNGSTVKVRFYRQEMNGTTPKGNSVLIAEKTAGPLPGFNSDNSPDSANWTGVTAQLDTTGLGGTTHIFWVVVWVEDSGGAMISELPGHGLSSKPGTLNTIGNVPLEMVTLDGTQKTFSNNVGYLHARFYIDEATAAPAPQAGDPQLEIVGAKVTPSTSSPGERVIISAHIFSEGAVANNVHVQFFPNAAAWEAYQADPTLPPPRPFDVEMLPHIDNGATDRLEVPYRAFECGRQNILIAAQSGVQGEVATAVVEFDNGPCMVFAPVVPIQ